MADVSNEIRKVEFSSPVEEAKYWREKVSLFLNIVAHSTVD